MENYEIIIITSTKHFDNVYESFKNSCRLRQNPDVYLTGLDVEYIQKNTNKNNFDEYTNWLKRADKMAVCKLQLASKNMCLVIDLCKFPREMPYNLLKILMSESWIKTGVGLSHDLSLVSYCYELGQCNGCIDVKIFAELYGVKSPKLTELYRLITGQVTNKDRKIDDTTEIRDWSKSLTMENVEYAAFDAVMSYVVGYAFVSNNSKFLEQVKIAHVEPCLIRTRFMKNDKKKVKQINRPRNKIATDADVDFDDADTVAVDIDTVDAADSVDTIPATDTDVNIDIDTDTDIDAIVDAIISEEKTKTKTNTKIKQRTKQKTKRGVRQKVKLRLKHCGKHKPKDKKRRKKTKQDEYNPIQDLHEYAQQNRCKPYKYDYANDTLNHEFVVSCYVSEHITVGHGNTQKEAKVSSAEQMLDILKN